MNEEGINKKTRIIGIIIIVIALIFGFRFVKSGLEILREQSYQNNKVENFKRDAYSSTGKITSVNVERQNHTEDSFSHEYISDYNTIKYYLQIEFEDSNGEIYNTEVPVNTTNFQQGDTVEVYYKPSNPYDCLVGAPPLVILTPVAIVYIVIGVFFLSMLIPGFKLCLKK